MARACILPVRHATIVSNGYTAIEVYIDELAAQMVP